MTAREMTAREQGALAFQRGEERNPYTEDDGLAEEWDSGWWDAREFAAEDFERGIGPAWAEY